MLGRYASVDIVGIEQRKMERISLGSSSPTGTVKLEKNSINTIAIRNNAKRLIPLTKETFKFGSKIIFK